MPNNNGDGPGNPGGGDTYIHPVSGYNSNPRGWDGGVADHMSRPFGNWQSDNAVDCMCSDGTPILAVADGTVGRVTPDTSYDPGANPNGDSVYLTCSGCEFWYTHMHGLSVEAGQKVSQGDRIGNSGTANGVAHLHFAANPANPPPANNPENVVSGGNIATGPGGGGGDPTTSSGIGFSNGDIFAAMRAAAFSTQFEIPGLADTFSQLFSGDKSIYNDQPLLPFIEQLCGASFRQFQSLPDGTFFAFFPDYFGAYGHRKPYWNIDDVEIIDGQIELTDENLATHVFVAGDVVPNGEIDWSEAVRSKGVITIFDAFNSETIVDATQPEDKPKKKEEEGRIEQTQFARLNARINALDFLRRYGIRPYYEAPSFIQNPYFEVFYAYITFQLMWAKQFLTTFTLTFMPELYPGGIVAFEKYGFQTYVDSVSHSFSYENGFTTQANLMAPSSLNANDPTYSRGMILANKTRDPTK